MILLIDNYDSFTWNLVQRLGEVDPSLELGRDLVVVRNDEIGVDGVAAMDGGRGPSHIVISPGPGGPKESGISREVIRRFAGRVPILGVCLGHQCMADVYGLAAARHAVQVHGKTSEIHHDGAGVFAGVESPLTAMRYHSLVVPTESIPRFATGEDGWAVSAWTFEDDENGGQRRVVMGLRRVFADAGRAPLEGVQFHPESFLTLSGHAILGNFVRMGAGTRGRVAAGAGAT